MFSPAVYVYVCFPLSLYQTAVDVEKSVKASFLEQEYSRCVDHIVQARRLVTSARVDAYVVLKPLRARMEVALTTLRDQLDGELVKVLCHPSHPCLLSRAHYALYQCVPSLCSFVFVSLLSASGACTLVSTHCLRTLYTWPHFSGSVFVPCCSITHLLRFALLSAWSTRNPSNAMVSLP